MSFVRFFCASHQREIKGGFDLDLETCRRLRLEPVDVFCPLCSKTHRFLLADAVEQTFESHESQAVAQIFSELGSASAGWPVMRRSSRNQTTTGADD
jgi:hypothetical protein